MTSTLIANFFEEFKFDALQITVDGVGSVNDRC